MLEMYLQGTWAYSLLAAYFDIGTVTLVILPFAAAFFAYRLVTNYYENHESLFDRIEEDLDAGLFRNSVIPFYISLNEHIFSRAITSFETGKSKLSRPNDVENFEHYKYHVLKEYDFSTLEESIKFQDTIKEIINARISHKNFQKLKELSEKSLWYSIVTGTISGVCGVISVYLYKFEIVDSLIAIFFSTYLIFLIITILLIFSEGIYRSRINKMRAKQ